MKQMGHTDFRPAIARVTEAVEVTSHGETMGLWLPKGSQEYDRFLAQAPVARPVHKVEPVQPRSSGASPHDEARRRQEQQRRRDEILRRMAK